MLLANLLPGFRHVRTPLATGYIYALALWLLLGSDRLIPDDDSSGAARRVGELSDLVGATATLAAVSFAAYLIGSTLAIRHWPFGMSAVGTVEDTSGPLPVTQYEPAPWVGGLLGWVYDVADRLGGTITYDAVRSDPNISREFVRELQNIFTAARKDRFVAFSVDLKSLLDDMDPIDPAQALEEQRARDAEFRLEPVPDDAYSWPYDLSSRNLVSEERTSDWWHFEKQVGPIPAAQLEEALFGTMDDEVTRIAARLQVQSEYVFNDYDRLQSEAELRYSISVPLAAVMIISSATWHWWALFGLVLPVILVLQAYRSERSSIGIILSAVQYGTVKSPTAEALRDASTPRAGAAPRETARGRRAAKSLRAQPPEL